MSFDINAHALLLGHVEKYDIVDYIYYHWDKDVKEYVNHYIDSNKIKNIKKLYKDKIYDDIGYIIFKYNEEKVMLLYHYRTYLEDFGYNKSFKYYKKYGVEDILNTEITKISFGGIYGKSEIMKDLCNYFGGWLNCKEMKEAPYKFIEPNRK